MCLVTRSRYRGHDVAAAQAQRHFHHLGVDVVTECHDPAVGGAGHSVSRGCHVGTDGGTVHPAVAQNHIFQWSVGGAEQRRCAGEVGAVVQRLLVVAGRVQRDHLEGMVAIA